MSKFPVLRAQLKKWNISFGSTEFCQPNAKFELHVLTNAFKVITKKIMIIPD